MTATSDRVEFVALAIHEARFAHPQRPRESSPWDKGDKEYAFRLARAALAAADAASPPPVPDRVEAALDAWFSDFCPSWREVSDSYVESWYSSMARALAAADAASPPPVPDRFDLLFNAIRPYLKPLSAWTDAKGALYRALAAADAASPPPVPEEVLSDLRDWFEECAANLQVAAPDGNNPARYKGPHPCDCAAFADDAIERVRSLLRSPPEPAASDSLSQSAERETQASADSERVDWLSDPQVKAAIRANHETAMQAKASAESERKWRVGDAGQEQYVYRTDLSNFVGLFATPELAALAVEAVNAIPALRAELEETRRLSREAAQTFADAMDDVKAAKAERDALKQLAEQRGDLLAEACRQLEECRGEDRIAALEYEVARLTSDLQRERADMDATMQGWEALCATSDAAEAERDALAKQVEAKDALIEHMATALEPFAKVTVLPSGHAIGMERAWFEAASAALDAYRKHKDQHHAE